MSESLIREIARQVAEEQFWQQWPFYLLVIFISLVFGFLAAYIGGYARKRGESFATKTDFNNLLEQLRSTTRLTEQIKTDLSHADWSARELKLLRRVKLEDLLQAIHELLEWQSQEMSRLVYSSGKEEAPSPVASIERISGLYFPELKEEITPFLKLHHELVLEMHYASYEMAGLKPHDVEARKLVALNYNSKHQPTYKEQLQLVSAVERRARDLMEEIINA